MPIPLYGFLQGDTIGLLMVLDDQETVGALAERLQEAAGLRVERRPAVRVVYKGRVAPPHATLHEAGFEALERFDVVPAQ